MTIKKGIYKKILNSICFTLTNASKSLNDALNTGHTKFVSEGWPSGQRQQTVNLPTVVYAGSNPAPSTILKNGQMSFQRV